ncbi:MAG: OmpA family protein [Bacteroidota bacterium]
MRYLTYFTLPIFALMLSLTPLLGQDSETDVQEILEKLNAGETVENMVINLGDINFRFGTADLEPRAANYLNQVVDLMQKAPNIDLYIQGFTDNVGGRDVNKKLSYDRAYSVQGYLEKNGIESGRLISEGFGSEKPVASNQTPSGRAQNRRVEMEVIKPPAVETIQDVIVLRNRQKIGATVLGKEDDRIRYQQFTSDDTLSMHTLRIDTIYYADGRVETFARPVKQKKGFGEWWEENVPFFKTSEAFHRGNFVMGFGIGLDNVDIGFANNERPLIIPPVMVIAELPVGYNVGVGLTAGAMHWGDAEADNILYEYYAVSARLAYHFNLGKKIDLYVGGALTGRRISVSNSEVSITRQEIDPGLLLGIRYYLNDTFGFFGEIGDESVAYPKLGLAIKFGN